MPGVKVVLPEIAHQMGALPLLWLMVMELVGRIGARWFRWRWPPRDPAWWWLAGAFTVSWLADWGAHWQEPAFMGLIYPVSQAGLVGAVLLSRRDALRLVGVLVAVGIIAAFWQRVQSPDVLLSTVAGGAIIGVVWPLRQLRLLRWALLIGFGLAAVVWLAFVSWGGWTLYGLYQTVRLAGIVLFCWVAVRPIPRLRLA